MTWREKWASAGPLKYVYVLFGVIGVAMFAGLTIVPIIDGIIRGT